MRGDIAKSLRTVLRFYFNSRPYVRGDIEEIDGGKQDGISIHAPT